ncbi:MAG TPA: extracellular solute-binding protein, partial [Spirochaetia bacterium]|nr:extracellular solute-binding protein [Spirochaetia bacterium]
MTVNWWFHLQLQGVEGQILTQYAKEFEARNPNVTVAYRSIPTDQYLQQLPTSIASGNAPDLFAMSYRNIFPYVDSNSLAPIDGAALSAMGLKTTQELLNAWSPRSLDAYKIGDRYYGLPFQFNIYDYIINTDQFQAVGIDPNAGYPKTWNDVFADAKKLVVVKDGRITR